jgi:hypothetical protein
MRTRTCSDHCVRGTCRGLRRGKNPGWEKFKNEGRDCRVIKNIWEKVRAEPEEKLSLQPSLKGRYEYTYAWVHEEKLFICKHISNISISQLRHRR